MNSAMGVAWLVLASIGLAGAAYLFRFEPMETRGSTVMWDRWHQRACFIVGPMAPLVCTREELDRLPQ